MTEFEEKCVKVLSVILLFLVVSIVVQLSSCVSLKPELPEGEPIPDYIDEVEMTEYA